MSVLRPDVASAPAALSPRGRDVWRAAKTPVIIGLIIIAASTFIALLQGTATRGRLDPEAADHPGSRAVAEILRDHGVRVVTARTAAEARAAAEPGTTLLVSRSAYFGPRGLASLAKLPGDRIVVEPTAAARTALAPQVTMAGPGNDARHDPGCTLPAARLAGDADLGGELGVTASGAVTCYADASGAGLVQYRDGSRTVTVLANGAPLTNGRLDSRGNAALALNLLGARHTLVWVCPLRAQPDSAQASRTKPLSEVLPAAPKLAGVQLAIAVLLIAAWRMRRLGPVVAEQLPVVVRAAETTEGRARLYRSRRARDRAAAALRSGFWSRVEPLLGLPSDADPDTLADAVARRSGRDAAEVRDLLYGAAPGDDSALVGLADRLDTLERQVRQS